MSIVPQIFDGMNGRRSINTIGQMPELGMSNNGFNTPIIRLNYTETDYVENMNCMRGSVLRTNQAGAYGVMPCKGSTAVGMTSSGATRTLRRQPISYLGGLYPNQGFARHQPIGLAYLKERPINLPLMPIADSFNAGLNSRLGQPV